MRETIRFLAESRHGAEPGMQSLGRRRSGGTLDPAGVRRCANKRWRLGRSVAADAGAGRSGRERDRCQE